MNILAELNRALVRMRLPVETGVFSNNAPDTYLVIIPLVDTFALHADDTPGMDVQEARISLFSKQNYIGNKEKLVQLLLANDFTITDRRYNGYEYDTGYHHYTIDVAKPYKFELEE